MGRKKKVVPTAEPAFVDDDASDAIENGGLDLEEEDSGRGLLIAVNKHVVNEDEEDEDEDDDEEAPKKRKELRRTPTLVCYST